MKQEILNELNGLYADVKFARWDGEFDLGDVLPWIDQSRNAIKQALESGLQKEFTVCDGGDLNSIEEWIMEEAGRIWHDPNDDFIVTVQLEVRKNIKEEDE